MMNFRISMMALGATAFIAGCGVSPEPIVASYNEASVDIQQTNIFGEANASDPAVIAEAQRICATTGRRAEYASTRHNTREYIATHLFLCLR